MALEDALGSPLMLGIAHVHPEHEAALVELPLQVVGTMIFDELPQSRADQAAGAAGHGRGQEAAGQGCHDKSPPSIRRDENIPLA